MNFIKYAAIEIALKFLKEFLTNPDARKFRKVRDKVTQFLVDEKTQQTFGDIFMYYGDLVEDLQSEEEEDGAREEE